MLLGGLLRCSERKSVRPRYHGGKISGGVYCAFHKHEQPRCQSSSEISDVTSPVKTREVHKTNDEILKPFGEGAPSQIFPEGKGVCTLANRNPPITDHKLFPTRSIKMIDGI